MRLYSVELPFNPWSRVGTGPHPWRFQSPTWMIRDRTRSGAAQRESTSLPRSPLHRP